MSMKRSIVSIIVYALLSIASVYAQYGPGWYNAPSVPLTPPPPEPGYSSEAEAAMSSGAPVSVSATAIAEEITPEIIALARNLENNPKRIYDFVHNHIKYVHYFGSKKGAMLTLLERSGNDFDQCALLVALLRAAAQNSGATYAVTYQFGVMEIPYASDDEVDLLRWLGLGNRQPDDQEVFDQLNNLQYSRGYPMYLMYGQLPTHILQAWSDPNLWIFHRVWVKLDYGSGTYYLLDPAFKVSKEIPGIDVGSAMQLNVSDLLDQSGGATVNANYVQNLNWDNLSAELTDYTANLLAELTSDTGHKNLSVEQVISGYSIQESETQTFPGLLFTTYTGSFEVRDVNVSQLILDIPAQEWSYIPSHYMSTVNFQVDNINVTHPMPSLKGQKITLTFAANQAQIRFDDRDPSDTTQTPQGSAGTSGSGLDAQMITSVKHPFGDWDYANDSVAPTMRFAQSDAAANRRYKRSSDAAYVIAYGFDDPTKWLDRRQRRLDEMIRQGMSLTSREVVTETLNVMSLSYLQQCQLMEEILGGLQRVDVKAHHRVGRVGQEVSYYIDLPLVFFCATWRDGSPSIDYPVQDVVRLHSMFASAFEHSVIEQFQVNNSASTIKGLYLANQQGQKLILGGDGGADSTTMSQLLEQETISPYSVSERQFLLGRLASGITLLVPSGNFTIGQWEASYVYARLTDTGDFAEMAIKGEFPTSGGWAGTLGTVNANLANNIYRNSPVLFQIAPSTQPRFTGADPVNMVDGSFILDATDLSVGQSEPRGFSFARHYDSNRRHNNVANMAPGWTHNYIFKASERSDNGAGLGKNTPLEMAAYLAGVRAAFGVIKDTSGFKSKRLAVVALIVHWATEQLRNNAVTITMGQDAIQFIKQPDGSYTAPAGITFTLSTNASVNNGNYVLKQRHGNTFNFASHKRIASIVDLFGKEMEFRYESDTGPLSEVEDAYGRILTLHYNTSTPKQLDYVKDTIAGMAERQVSFGYHSTTKDLTSVTDVEGKASTIVYDPADHKITQTLDAEGRTVTSNIYDEYGRVIEQHSEGDASKKWVFYWGEYCNIEQDPKQGQRRFHYDEKHRSLGIKDANGNRSYLSYDGQDHVIRQITPKNEITTFEYDGRHNLTKTINPALREEIRNYNADNTLNYIIDFNGHQTEFAYTPQFQLQTVTSPDISDDTSKPNIVVYDYYQSDDAAQGWDKGLLQSVTDSGFVETKVYKYGWGVPKRVDYPNTDYETYVINGYGDPDSHTDARGNTTQFQYNKRRQITKTRAPKPTAANPNVNAPGTDDADATVVINEYDDNARLWKVTDPNGNVIEANTYSATGKLTTRTLARLIINGVNVDPVITYHYDERDWLESVDTPFDWDAVAGMQVSKTTEFDYDPGQRLEGVTDPLLRTTAYGYDANGNRTSVTTPLDTAGQTTVSQYDNLGRLEWILDAEQRTKPVAGQRRIYFRYDDVGNRTEVQNRRHITDEFNGISPTTYYQDNRLKSSSTPLGFTKTYRYNTRALLDRVVEPSLQETLYRYDLRGRANILVDTLNPDVAAAQPTFTYDGNGNLLIHRERDPETDTTKTMSREYDSLNRIFSFIDSMGNTIGYRYDNNGNLKKLIYPGGKEVDYEYDSHNRLTSLSDWATPPRVTTFEYDLAGRLKKLTRPNGTFRTIQYDDAGQTRVIWERRADGTPIALFKLDWDAGGRIRNEFIAPLPQSYSSPNTPANPDEDNRLIDFKGETIVHDADGNMTTGPLQSSSLVTYTYDARNRLTHVDSGGFLPSVDYHYDSEGNRVLVTSLLVGPGHTPQQTSYIVNPTPKLSQILVRINPDLTKTFFVYGLGLLYDVDESENTRTYHYDYRGSTRALTDDSAKVTARIEYDSYGNITRQTVGEFGVNFPFPVHGTPFLYNGRYGVMTDPNGLLYMRARYYNPHMKRFLNPDPIGFSGGMNFYAYADGNPISYLDPFGLGAVGERGSSWLITPSSLGGWAADQGINITLGSASYASRLIGGGVENLLRVPAPHMFAQAEAMEANMSPFGRAGYYDTQNSVNQYGAMATSILSKKPAQNVRPPNLTPAGAGRTGALHEALRRNNVPTSQQPTRVLPNLDKRGNVQPGRVYEYDVPAPGGGTRTVRIRDDAGGHDYGLRNPQNRGPHFNDEAGNHYDY